MKRVYSYRSIQALAGILLATVFSATSYAQCLGSAMQRSVMIPAVESPDAAAQLEAKVVSDRAEAAATTSTNPVVSIVGLWNVTFSSGGQAVDQGFDQWQLGGTEVLNDTPPPATGNVCLGVWVQLSPHVYKLKHPSWTFDNSGNLTGTAIITEQVTIDVAGNKYQGPYSYDIYDLNGNKLQHFAGTLNATRITAN